MRIDAYNKVSQLYQATSTKKTNKADKVSASDKYEVSETGKYYQIAKQAVSAAPDVREDKVNDIKNRLASGTYNLNSEEIASALVDRYFDTKA